MDPRPLATSVRLLVIDDDPLVRRSLQRSLSAAECIVECAEAMVPALRWLAEHPCDLVICDMYMPDHDGLECLGELRRLHPRTPVIIMSGQLTNAFGGTLRQVVTMMGAAGVLPKTVDRKDLIALIRRLVPPPAPDPA
jgi:DNA-binding NtrC family response regulator